MIAGEKFLKKMMACLRISLNAILELKICLILPMKLKLYKYVAAATDVAIIEAGMVDVIGVTVETVREVGIIAMTIEKNE